MDVADRADGADGADRADGASTEFAFAFLFADTGGGHRASALAVKQALESNSSISCRVELLDPTANSRSSLVRSADMLYGRCIRSAPWFWAVLFHLSNRRWVVRLLRLTVLHGLGSAVSRQSGGSRFDGVVSFHPLLGDASRCLADTHPSLRSPAVEAFVATVVTDLVSPHAAWAHRNVDAMFVPNATSAAALVERGVDPRRCHRVGLPVGLQFVQPRSATDIGRAEVRARLELDDRFTVLLVGGGEGTGGLFRKARAVLRACEGVQVCVVTGRNQRLRRRLERLQRSYVGTLHVAGFVDNMADWMRVADIVISRAGPGTLAESFAVGTPVLVTGHLPGQERHNPEFVSIGRAGFETTRLRHITSTVNEFAAHPERLEPHVWSARLLARPSAAADIAAHLVRIAQERRAIFSAVEPLVKAVS